MKPIYIVLIVIAIGVLIYGYFQGWFSPKAVVTPPTEPINPPYGPAPTGEGQRTTNNPFGAMTRGASAWVSPAGYSSPSGSNGARIGATKNG